ncbi:MAG: polysaccharide deacetylase family protein [Bryobacteraceae bacterium]|nr:polysaccharide deacetylase family protein [Bryobacteraceae bacterium]
MRLALIFLLAAAIAFAERQVAITIDDLPRGGDAGSCGGDLLAFNRAFLVPLRAARIPFSGFVNEGRCQEKLGAAGLGAVLRPWKEAGAELGNHTAGHPNYHQTPREEFFAGILEGARVTEQVIGVPVKYFRHPFLHMGKTLEDKRALETFLRAHGYVIAPITIDTSDYVYAAIYPQAKDAPTRQRIRTDYLRHMEELFSFFEKRSREVLGREIAQTLLIHANQLNRGARTGSSR